MVCSTLMDTERWESTPYLIRPNLSGIRMCRWTSLKTTHFIPRVPFFLLGLALYMICCRTKQRDPDEDDLIVPQPRLSSSIYIIPMHNEEGEEGEEEEDDEDAEHLCGFSSPPRYSDPPSYNSLSLHCPPPYCQVLSSTFRRGVPHSPGSSLSDS